MTQKGAGRQHCHCEWKLEKKETIEKELDAVAQWQTHQEDKKLCKTKVQSGPNIEIGLEIRRQTLFLLRF